MSSALEFPVSAASSIRRSDWDRLTPASHPFLNADFFEVLERHGTAGPVWGWQANHWVVQDADGSVAGIAPTYLKAHSHGEFLRDWAWANAYEQLGKSYYPKLVTALPHTPATGPRLLTGAHPSPQTVQQRLIDALKQQVAELRLSSWHIALPTREELSLLQENGLVVSHDVQFHWRNHGYLEFDDYLAAFPSEKRRKIKAERRRVAESGLTLEVLHGDEVPVKDWPSLHTLYTATFDKYGNYAAFSAECFAELGLRLGRRMVLFVAREKPAEAPVAMSVCFRSNDTLYGRYWGTQADYHSLHFELCFYQGIAYCLKEGLTTFEPGAGGEHKVARGFEPTIVRSSHWIRDPKMRALIGNHLERHREAIRAYAEEAASHLPFRDPPPATVGRD